MFVITAFQGCTSEMDVCAAGLHTQLSKQVHKAQIKPHSPNAYQETPVVGKILDPLLNSAFGNTSNREV